MCHSLSKIIYIQKVTWQKFAMNSNKNATTINLRGRLANLILPLMVPCVILYSTSSFSAFRCSETGTVSQNMLIIKIHNVKEPQFRLSEADVFLFWKFRTNAVVWGFWLFEFLEYFYSHRQSLLSNFSVQGTSVLKKQSFRMYPKWKTEPGLYLYLCWWTKIGVC